MGRRGLRVHDDRDRPVVDELELHPSAEDACLDAESELAQREAEGVVEPLGVLRRCGVAEARPVALRRVGDQRELADDERLAADVERG
ncbi:MAG TPA: hypothetical protein VIF85_10860 [Gaiellaceae bacterium]